MFGGHSVLRLAGGGHTCMLNRSNDLAFSLACCDPQIAPPVVGVTRLLAGEPASAAEKPPTIVRTAIIGGETCMRFYRDGPAITHAPLSRHSRS